MVGKQAHQEAQEHRAQGRLAPQQHLPCDWFLRLQGSRVLCLYPNYIHPINYHNIITSLKTDWPLSVIKGVDSKPPAGPFGGKLPFGELLCELESTNGWVHAIKWSPSGNQIAFSGHDSSVSFSQINGQTPQVQRIRLPYLPIRELLFLSEKSVVAVGEDANPLLFTSNDSGVWSFASEVWLITLAPPFSLFLLSFLPFPLLSSLLSSLSYLRPHLLPFFFFFLLF